MSGQKNVEKERQRRSTLSFEQLKVIRDSNTEARRFQRYLMAEEKKEERRIADTKAHQVQRPLMSEEKKDERRIANTSAHQVQRNPQHQFSMAERDPVVAQHLLWASSCSHLDKLSQGNDDPERQWNIDTDFLNPISVEEKKVAITKYLEVMDPQSTIYACACCGEWVIKLKSKEPNKRYIKDLHILELSDSLKLKYQNVPDGFKRIKGVTETIDGKYYGLYRPYLDVATDPHETCYPDAPVDSDTTSAFL
jgi:hypothetical protein